MKITCNRGLLQTAFQTAATVVPSRSPKPVLQNVKMEATSDRVTLIATDMEVGIRIDVPDQQAEIPGSALLSVAQFGSILREANDESLTIEADGQGILVRGERSRFKLPSGNPQEFPDVAEFSESNYFTIGGRLFKELIRRTLFATDAESSRYALGGILLEFDEDQVTAVATDGRRLAKMSGPLGSEGNPSSGDSMTIVPSRSMQLIERALMNTDADVHLATRGNDFMVRCPTATVTTRLVEGRFPRWRDVLPNRPEAILIDMTVGPLLSALRQAAIVTSGESRGIDFVFGEGALTLRGLTADIGESEIQVPIAYDGELISMCLDHRYVADFLKVLDGGRNFTLNIVDGDSAAFFETDDGYGYVVMPLARDRAARPKTQEAAAH
ncbi:MAG: DNA polymerase III subunit beta [Planctomycetales bacterium]|nr:DNA polymerase III subunit beta [Planctomycetales bacterium]MCA9171560.1 DNA polymerase III subunit beta [Planctomycetales bacterium]